MFYSLESMKFIQGYVLIFIFLFVLIVQPSSFCMNRTETSPLEESSVQSCNYNCYNASEKFSQKIITTKVYLNQLENSSEPQTFGPLSNNSNGLMDSPWPMYCHDVRHTGQSPYSTQNTSNIELWRWLWDGEIYGSPALDQNGAIHFGAPRYYFTIFPNGTE